ncbi:hypothetical protein Tco_1458479 [Tanacetum coccineum]
MVEVARRLLRLQWCRSGGCGGAVVMLMAAAVGDEGDGDEVVEAGDAVVYDDGGRRQMAGVWSDSSDGAGVISERVCVCEIMI